VIELIKDLLGINNVYPENDKKEVTLTWCSGCGGWLDAMAYRFYKNRGYKITRREAVSHRDPVVWPGSCIQAGE
jgi:hypothetical protein